MRNLAEVVGMPIHAAGFEGGIRRAPDAQVDQRAGAAGRAEFLRIKLEGAHARHQLVPGFGQRHAVQVGGRAGLVERGAQPESAFVADAEAGLPRTAVKDVGAAFSMLVREDQAVAILLHGGGPLGVGLLDRGDLLGREALGQDLGVAARIPVVPLVK